MSFLTHFFTRLSSRPVGTDRFGNAYYESRADMPGYPRKRRFVLYKGAPDPTAVPSEWHAWLHHTTDAPLPEVRLYAWQREHQANLTGTPAAWKPPGHDSRGGARQKSAGDYDAWTP